MKAFNTKDSQMGGGGVFLSRLHLLVSVAVADVQRVHGLDDRHDGLQRVAVDDGDELQAFLKRVTIFVDNSGGGRRMINSSFAARRITLDFAGGGVDK